VTPDGPVQPVTDISAVAGDLMDALAAAGIIEDDDPDPGVVGP